MFGAIDLVELQIFHQLRRCSGGMNEANRMLVRIDGIERHFHFGGHHAGVHLGHQRGHIGWKGRDMRLA